MVPNSSTSAGQGGEPENPPAFPQQCDDALGVGMVHEGMSLRDWFATNAPHGAFIRGTGPHDPAKMAQAAYRYADAMLAERAKGEAQ